MSPFFLMKNKYSHIKLGLLSLDEGGWHIIISGRVNGNKVCFIVDTGSSRTVLDKKTVDEFIDVPVVKNAEGKAVTLSKKAIEVDTVTIPVLSFGKTVVTDYKVVVMDLSGVHDAYAELKLPHIHGIIGSDLLKHLDAVIDYGTLRIRLSR